MFSSYTQSSILLQDEDVQLIGHPRFNLLSGIALMAVLVANPQFGFSVQTKGTSAAPRSRHTATRQSAPKRPAAKGNSDAEELARRFQAAQAASASGDSDAVITANKRLAAFALRQLGNLRLLEKAAPQAVEILRESVALEDTPESRMALAVAALSADQADEALAQTAKLTESNSSNYSAWFVRGKALTAKKDFQGAITAFERARQLKDDANTRFLLAVAYLNTKDKPKAETIFKQMLADYGDRAIWHVIIAGAYRESGNNEDAIREFRRAIAMQNDIDHAHFFLGLTLLQQNHWAQTDESMAEFREAARLDPEDYSSNFYLGAGEAEFKQFESSNRHLMVAAKKDPNVPEIWQYLGLNAFQQQNLKDARTYLEKAIELTGTDESRNNYQLKKAYIALSRIAFSEGKKEEAQQFAMKARDLQSKSLVLTAESMAGNMEQGGMGQTAAVMPHSNLPQEQAQTAEIVDPTATVSTAPLSPEQAKQAADYEKRLRQIISSSLNDWGTAEARQGMFAFALEHFQKAEKWDNTTPGLMRNLGFAALKLDNVKEGIRALQEAVKLDPSDVQTRARLAMTLYTASDYAGAASQFAVLGNTVYSDPGMAYAWGYSLVQTNQSKQAVVVLDSLMNHELPAEVLVSVGDLYGVLEFYEPALKAYRKALQEQPGLPKLHYKMGAALIRLDQMAEAVTELREALQQTPDDIDVQYNLAYALLQTSQKDQAMALLQTVITSKPDHPQAQYELGKALLEEGKLQDAVPHLEVAAKLDPARDYVHYQLQVCYRRLGRTAEADSELQVYREIKARKRDSVVIPKASDSPQ
ncbi:MAG TPA: tetratricopeptide repeat protein [Terriglobales bacterium]|nr:tetratricopeptide repeat protein [Terriglobales bacterium]